MRTKQNLSDIISNKFTLYKIQCILSSFALGIAAWSLADGIRTHLLQDYNFKMYSWVDIFFYPLESNLLNYVNTSFALALWAIVIYFVMNERMFHWLKNKIELNNLLLLQAVVIVSAFTTVILPFMPVWQRFVLSMILFAALFLLIWIAPLKKIRLSFIPASAILLILSLEPLLIIKGPAYLMNEYQDIYGDTYVRNASLNNKQFLEHLDAEKDIQAIKLFNDYVNQLKGRKPASEKVEHLDFLRELKSINLEPIQSFYVSVLPSQNLSGNKLESANNPDRGDAIMMNIEEIKRFYLYNSLEYFHQNMSRGQMNHIGHILNPLNEFVLGKPLKDIYIQYGLGSTFIIKWTMDLFGGISIDNYYKIYIYYVVYFIGFMGMLYILFRDPLYVLIGSLFLAGAYYFQGYIALMLAPGILPLIHFLDVPTIILLLLFFRSQKFIYSLLSALFSLVAILINGQFGMMLFISWIVAMLLFVIENNDSRSKVRWFSYILIVFAAGLLLARISNPGASGTTFSYFFMGLFSWPAHPLIVVLTFVYLITSYSFIMIIKNDRFSLKYVYIFLFAYTQCLFLYYYWSGLSNHLPTVIPFAGLQLLVMIAIAEEKYRLLSASLQKLFKIAKTSLLIILLLLTFIVAKGFYKEKIQFHDIFSHHKVYDWNFSRAHLKSTINTELIKENVDLIKEYSTGKGIYIISKYDNVLPFLSERYSLMPYFEMSWHLFSEKDTQAAVSKIEREKPGIIFVDTNISRYGYDPWAKIYSNKQDIKERASRFGRNAELNKLFMQVSSHYEKIKEGSLISVYKRKTS